MTVEVILNKIQYLRIHYDIIIINFYQNRFINECVRKNFHKNSQKDRRKDVKTERRKDGRHKDGVFCEM